VRNVGGGHLNARIAAAPEWIDAQLTGDTLTLRPEPKAPESLLGDVVIHSNGGSATIRVTANRAADQAQPRPIGLWMLRSKRTNPRPRAQYVLLCLASLAIGIGFTVWASIYAAHHWGGNPFLIWTAVLGYVVALIMFGRAAFRGRRRRWFWRFPPPWLEAELSGATATSEQRGTHPQDERAT
jgi:hypothetical protein